MAQEAWRAYLEMAIGATEATRKRATKAVQSLVGRSAVTAEQVQSMAEDLLRTSAENREAVARLVRAELERALGAVGLATADEVAALNARIDRLEAKLRASTATPSMDGAAVTTPVAKKVVAKKAVAKKAVAKKTVAKKAKAALAPVSDPVPATPSTAATEPLSTRTAASASAKRATAKKAMAKKTTAKKAGGGSGGGAAG